MYSSEDRKRGKALHQTRKLPDTLTKGAKPDSQAQVNLTSYQRAAQQNPHSRSIDLFSLFRRHIRSRLRRAVLPEAGTQPLPSRIISINRAVFRLAVQRVNVSPILQLMVTFSHYSIKRKSLVRYTGALLKQYLNIEQFA